MKAGIFMMPSHPPERDLCEGHEWHLKHLAFVDQLGFHEAWILRLHGSPTLLRTY